MSENHMVLIAWLVLAAAALSSCASLESDDASQPAAEFRYTLSSGLFSLPDNAQSLDWAIINNAASEQRFRITVYQVGAGEKAAVVPGPITASAMPFHSYHNANSVGHGKPFAIGWDYEVVVEVNSMRVLPTVEVWANHGNKVIPGTSIGPAQFVEIGRVSDVP